MQAKNPQTPPPPQPPPHFRTVCPLTELIETGLVPLYTGPEIKLGTDARLYTPQTKILPDKTNLRDRCISTLHALLIFLRRLFHRHHLFGKQQEW